MDNMTGSGIDITIAGIAIVFAVLALTSLVVALIRRFDDRLHAGEEAARSRALEKAPTIDTTTLVAIRRRRP